MTGALWLLPFPFLSLMDVEGSFKMVQRDLLEPPYAIMPWGTSTLMSLSWPSVDAGQEAQRQAAPDRCGQVFAIISAMVRTVKA